MSRHARKLSLLLALTLCALCVLTGCHGSRGLSTFKTPAALNEEKPQEITFWAKNDTNKTQTQIYEQAIADFQALYPHITVTLRLYTDYGRIYNDVITNIATGTTPNVCITYPDHIATYKTGLNVMVPLDELMDDPRYGLGGSEVRFDAPTREELIPQFLQECAIDGHYYALPFMRSTEACYINKTYVEKLGYQLPEQLTWDFVWAVANAATQQDEEGNYLVNGQKVMIPFIYKSTDNMMIQLLRQQNAPYSTPDGTIGLFNDTTRALLYTIADNTRTGAFSTFKISGYPANYLNAGQCIFAIDSTAGSTWMGMEAPLSDISPDKLVPFETAVRMLPQFDPAHPQMISQGPSVCLFNQQDEQQVLAAWLFTQYLLSNPVQVAYARTEGYVPATVKARQSAEYQDYLSRGGEDNDAYYAVKLAATRLLLEHTQDTFVTPVFNGSASLRDAAGQLIENVAKSTRRKQTVDDAYIDKLYADVNALYRLDQRDGSSAGKTELGALPVQAQALLGALVGVWVLMGLYALYSLRRRRAQRR